MRLRAVIKIGPDLGRSLESDDVAERLFELLALVVEGSFGHRDADRAQEATLVVEHRRGQAAEIALELLALARDTRDPDVAKLLVERVRVGDGG